MKRGLLLLCFASLAQARPDLREESILAPRARFHIERVALRATYYDQRGRGYQSQAGPPEGPGSEELTVWQPQLEVIARQGERVTHRLWVPVDIVTAASPDAIDAISTASRTNEAGSLELVTTYRADPHTRLTFHPGFHMEEHLRSWHIGFALARAFADDNATLTASVDQALDWFDIYTIRGLRRGHAGRSTSNLSVGLTQLLSPTTVANMNYGFTLQVGELGNTWNSVPLPGAMRGPEILPRTRQRHALVARLAQFLPWQGALHLSYRFYADDWSLLAHTGEAALYQRLSTLLLLRGSYRFHRQDGARFFAERPSPTAPLRTSDSDLGPFDAQTLGGALILELPLPGRIQALRLEAGYDRYFRSNDLDVDIVTWALGMRM